MLSNLLEEEVSKNKNVAIGGFSQGGAMALLVGLTSKHALSGEY